MLLFICCVGLLTTVATAQKPAAPKSKAQLTEDTIQYALGVYMMQQYFAKSGFDVTNQALFTKAINDVLSKKPLMVNPASTEERLLAYQKTYMLEKGKQLQKLIFEKAKTTPGFQALPSGVYFSVAKLGTGAVPTIKDTIIMNVTMTLPDGKVIEDASVTKQSYMILASDMITGLRDIVLRMPEGSICRAIVPSNLAYGEVGTPTIPPNSAIIYDVALVSVRKAK